MALMTMLKRGKIHPRHQLVFNMIDCIVEGIHKFIEVLFVKKDLVFLIREAFIVLVEALFTFCDRHIKVVCTGRFHIKKISALARLHFQKNKCACPPSLSRRKFRPCHCFCSLPQFVRFGWGMV